MTTESEQISLVKDLAEAASTQAKAANEAWLATITFSVLLLLPRASTTTTRITLPFSIGDVEQTIFYPVGFAMLTVLILALAVTHAQSIRTHAVAHSAIDTFKSAPSSTRQVTPRELFDILRTSSLTRVAPLAELIPRAYHLVATKVPDPAWLRNVTRWYYLLLKLVATTVLFVLPLLALGHVSESRVNATA